MSMTRLKIITGDTEEIVEGKVNNFLASDKVYAVERLLVYPKTKDNTEAGGYYCYITYKEKYPRNDNAEN